MRLFIFGALSGVLGLSTQSAYSADINFFEKAVRPVLEAKCVSCHGPKKVKGKLRLDTYAAIMKGGSEGDTVVKGNLDDSSLWWRLELPLDDDEHMPPEDKPQLEKVEKGILKFWLLEGAQEKHMVSKVPDEVAKYLKRMANRVDPAVKRAMVAKARKEIDSAMKNIPDLGASIMPLSQEDAELRFNCINVVKTFGDEQLAKIAPVSPWMAWVNLGRSQVTDKGLATLSKMPKLERLHLEKTKVTDAGLDTIATFKNLKYLNLYGTEVTDAGVMKLAGLPKLEKVFLWQTKVTPEGAKKLKAKLPNTQINIGWEHEPPVKVVTPPKPAGDAKKEEPKKDAAKPGPAKSFAELAKFFDQGSCCFKAHKGGKECKHGCCVKATTAGKVCKKCNPKTKGPA